MFKHDIVELVDDRHITGALGEIALSEYLGIPFKEDGTATDFWLNGLVLNVKSVKCKFEPMLSYMTIVNKRQINSPVNMIAFARVAPDVVYLVGYCMLEYFRAHSQLTSLPCANGIGTPRYEMSIRLLSPIAILLDIKDGC
jgi:hypothetical protein